MSGAAWQEKARRIIYSNKWPENISNVDKKAVQELANGMGYEPYFTLKAVIEGIEGGWYQPSRFSNERK